MSNAKILAKRTLVIEPAGSVCYFMKNAIPDGYLKANGAAVSRTAYADLFAVLGTTFGVGNGTTTFNLPDLRGQFVRGFDDGRGLDSGRSFGSDQGDAIRNLTGSFGYGTSGLTTPSGVFQQTSVSGNRASLTPETVSTRTDFSAANQVPTAAENRPKNIAVLACIKY